MGRKPKRHVQQTAKPAEETQDAPPRETPPRETTPQAVPSPQAPSQLPPQQAPPRVVPPQQAPPRVVPPQQAPPRVVPPQQAPPRVVPPQQAPPRVVPPQQAPPQQAPPRVVPPQVVSPQVVPPQELPSAPTPTPIMTKSKKNKQKFKKMDLGTVQVPKSETQVVASSQNPSQPTGSQQFHLPPPTGSQQFHLPPPTVSHQIHLPPPTVSQQMHLPPPTHVQRFPDMQRQLPAQMQPAPIIPTFSQPHIPAQQAAQPSAPTSSVSSTPVQQAPPAPNKGKKGKGKQSNKNMDETGDALVKLKIDDITPQATVSAPQVIPSQMQKSKKEEAKGVPGPARTPIPSSSPAQLPATSQKVLQQPSQVTTQHKTSQGTPPPADSPSHGSSLKVPKRNGNEGNKVGRKIKVETNYLPLTIATKKDGIHYDVTIVPDKPKKFLIIAMQKYITKSFPGRYPAFDGQKNLYSCGELPLPSGYHSDTVEIIEEGRKDPLKFEVSIKMVARVDFSSLSNYMKQGSSQDAPQRAIQCLDVILRHAPLLRFIKVGKSFFSPPEGKVVSLGGGLDMWYGLFQSAILGWKPFINIDIAHKGFPKRQNVVDLIQDLVPREDIRRGQGPLRPDAIDNLKKFIKGLKVEYEIPGHSASKRSYRVNDVVNPPGQIRFTMDDGRQLTVTEYFSRERSYNIKYPNLPCLWVGNRNSERRICYPVELCIILPGQVIIRKMDGIQTSNMIRESACPANERKMKIMSALQSMRYNQEPTLKEFGLKVSERFEEVEGRIIPAPPLEYANKTIVEPRSGVWRAGRFQKAAVLTNWMIISLDKYLNKRSIENMVDTLITMGKNVGMVIDRPNIYEIQLRDLKPVMSDAVKNKTQLVMAIVSDSGVQYAQVKQAAELTYGVLTQCVKKTTVERKMNDATASQLLLKINAKLDQANHSLKNGSVPCLKRPCMIIGADVTHPAPGQMGEPSIAAVVASHDPNAYKYNITVRLQPPKTEIITDLRAMIKEQLMFFYKKTTFKPLQIIYFRDGVSEGQFESVLNSELTAIRAACSDLGGEGNYKPLITFFVVQKRHHTRFFPVDSRDGDRNQNVPVGTCVDSVITHPTELDFYLLSHASIKGTARPTRYHRLWDDADMSEAEVQLLAFQLCHLYTRCNRSVSYPAPTYYAHHAAARAKVHTEGITLNMDNLQTEQIHLRVKDEIRKERPMFFV